MEEYNLIRIFLALGFVISLIFLVSFTLKRLQNSRFATGISSQKRRLTLLEQLPLDAKRRLILVRCDETEHLILLGLQGETVVSEAPKS